ncbi:MAG: hypothetical protein KDK45_25740, partial [Leptospiraceae bacterium]|nr:hypothetical protein [Leptospiraceae bacterium]
MIRQQSYDKTLDYYSLGIVLYEFLLGYPPFYSTSFEELKSLILYSEISFPSDSGLSSSAKDLITKLAAKDLKKRLGFLSGSSEILSHPWLSTVNIELIRRKNVKPPIIPNLYEINFDQEFIKKDIRYVDEVCSEEPEEKFGLYDRFSNFSFSIDTAKDERPSINTLMMTTREYNCEKFELLSLEGHTFSEKLPNKRKPKMKLKIFNEEFKNELNFLSVRAKNNENSNKVGIFEGKVEDIAEETPVVQKLPKSKFKYVGNVLKKEEIPFIDNDLSSIKSNSFCEIKANNIGL